MKTKFKDVAHLYLGCKIESFSHHKNDWDISTMHGIINGYVFVEGDNNAREISGPTGATPILRPLSDMNALEDREAIRLRMHGETGLHGAAESIRFMLSKHFDLFNLIENSEAIDSTTLKTNPYE